MNNTQSKARLAHGSVAGHLVRVTLPMMMGVFAIISVGVADAYFLGQYSTDGLAAVSFIYPVMFALSSIGIGLAAGLNSVVSRALGQENETKAHRLANSGVVYAFLLGISISILGFLSYNYLFELMGANAATLPLISDYMGLFLLAFPFMLVAMSSNSLLRAQGEGLRPALVILSAAFVNIALDPLFIFGYGPVPEMGVYGAGLATLCGHMVSLCVGIYFLLRSDLHVSIAHVWNEHMLASIKEITSIGAPAAANNAINPLSLAVVTGIISVYGQDVVAGFGAATRIYNFLLVPMLALSASIGPVVGQNWGAEKFDRVKLAMVYTFGFCVVYGLTIGAIAFLFRSDLAVLFTDNPDAVSAITAFLAITSWGVLGYGVLVVVNGALNAQGKPNLAVTLSIIRSFVLFVPLSWAAQQYGTFETVLYATLVTDIAVAFIALGICYYAGLMRGKLS